MGLGGISIWQLLIVLVIVFAVFGTKKLRSIGGDLGAAIKGFKQGIKDDAEEADGEKNPLATENTDKINAEKPADPLRSDTVTASKDPTAK